eukprot:m.423234 g.423234  ORF g.423234 m.423234 type:complete len:105 (-) comp40545_c0_seq1:1931-2245(-)
MLGRHGAHHRVPVVDRHHSSDSSGCIIDVTPGWGRFLTGVSRGFGLLCCSICMTSKKLGRFMGSPAQHARITATNAGWASSTSTDSLGRRPVCNASVSSAINSM